MKYKIVIVMAEIILTIFTIVFCWNERIFLSIAWLLLLSVKVLDAAHHTKQAKERGKDI